jgi:hypothetical protein
MKITRKNIYPLLRCLILHRVSLPSLSHSCSFICVVCSILSLSSPNSLGRVWVSAQSNTLFTASQYICVVRRSIRYIPLSSLLVLVAEVTVLFYTCLSYTIHTTCFNILKLCIPCLVWLSPINSDCFPVHH